MEMHDPPHPGELIEGLWMEPLVLTMAQVAHAMGIATQVLSNLIEEKQRVTPDIAIRLSITLGSSAESWLGHQSAYDLWQVRQQMTTVQATPLVAAPVAARIRT